MIQQEKKMLLGVVVADGDAVWNLWQASIGIKNSADLRFEAKPLSHFGLWPNGAWRECCQQSAEEKEIAWTWFTDGSAKYAHMSESGQLWHHYHSQ